MRWFLAVAALAVLALVGWWWASGRSERAGILKREGSGDQDVFAPEAPHEQAPAESDAEETVPSAPADLGELTLRVIDEAGAPIAGAWVEVRRDERQPVTDRAVADGLGRATVRLTRTDRLFVGARGFLPENISGALRRRIEEVTLKRGYDIEGVVVDGAGKGIEGATLTLSQPFLPERSAASDARGRFAFEDVGKEVMRLGAAAEGYGGNGTTVTPGDADVRIVLRAPMKVDGVVVFPDGTPAVGAKVGGRPVDPDGRFEIEVVPGRIEIWAQLETPERRWWSHVDVEIEADGSHAPIRIVLCLQPRSWVRVRALDVDGSPLTGVVIGGIPMTPPYPSTGADGRVLCAFDREVGTEATVYVCQERKDGLLPGRAAVTTGEREGKEVVLRPREPRLVTVVVRGPDGSPLPSGVQVSVDAYGNRVVRREVDGAVIAVDPVAGSFAVNVRAHRYRSRFVSGPLPADDRLEVRLGDTGALLCRIVDATGRAVVDGRVSAGVEGVGRDYGGEMESSGVYRIGGAPVGHAVVTAGRSGGPPLVRTEVDVRAGETIDLGTLRLGEPSVLDGRVTDMNGRPIGGALVEAVDEGWEAQMYSRSDGSFRILASPWLQGHVVASKSGYGTAQVLASGSLSLVLPPEGHVRLEVRVPPAEGARAYSFEARDPTTGFQWSLRDWARIEEAPGARTYLVNGLPPGRLILVAATLPRSGETEVVVVAGETVPAVVEIPE